MEWIDLGVPRPKEQPELYQPVKWDSEEVISLAMTKPNLTASVGAVMNRRRSSRRLESMPLSSLADLLATVSQVRDRLDTPYGFSIERRPTPSAGAIHPIHIVVEGPGIPWSHYEAKSHALSRLSNGHLLEPLGSACAEIIDAPNAWTLLFIAEPGRTAAKYAFAQSLVWRDAGVLQGTLAIAAEALDIGFCLLGLTGEPWASMLSENRLIGVGVALAGAR